MERAVCKNPWCKATFEYKEEDMVVVAGDSKRVPPQQCKKCKSFATDLSTGVEWKEKKYEGSRDDGQPHEIRYKVNKFF